MTNLNFLISFLHCFTLVASYPQNQGTFFQIVFFFSKITLTSVLIRGGSSLLRILLDFPFHLPLSLQRKPMMVQSSLSQKTICIFALNIIFVCLAEYFTILIFLSNCPPSLQKWSSATTQYTSFCQHFIFHFRMPCP